jgi:hypothetical protein
MPNLTPPPLSSTVSSVFEGFLKKLEDEKVLSKSAQEALAQSLSEQKLDSDTLRKAIFTSDAVPK